MTQPGDYIPEGALPAQGPINVKVSLAEFDDGVRRLVLHITEFDGTLHFFPLDATSARWLGNKLLEHADAADEPA